MITPMTIDFPEASFLILDKFHPNWSCKFSQTGMALFCEKNLIKWEYYLIKEHKLIDSSWNNPSSGPIFYLSLSKVSVDAMREDVT